MSHFITIPLGHGDVLLNASDVTMLSHSEYGVAMTDKSGVIFTHRDEKKPLDIDQITAQLPKLVTFHMRDDDGNSRGGVAHINPAAITYITASAEVEGKHGVIVGVEGAGARCESYHVTPDELKTLVDAMRAAKKEMVEFTADEAHARWSKQGMLYVDTAVITHIKQDGGGQLWVGFKNSGQLDIQPPRQDRQQIYRELINQTPSLKADFDKASYLLQKEERRRENITLAALAKKLSAGNPALVHIPCDTHAIYLQPADIVRIFPDVSKEDGAQLYIEFHGSPRSQYTENARAMYGTIADRDAALAVLTGKSKPAASAKPSAKK